MKKNPEDYDLRQARIARFRLRSYLRGRRTQVRRNSTESLASVLNRHLFFMPEQCSFAPDDIDDCLQNINDLALLLAEGKKLLIDFSKTAHIYATYAVYLYSELQNLIKIYGVGSVYINLQSLNNTMRFLVKESGILRLTNGTYLSAGRKGFLPVICGTKDDEINVIINFIISTAGASGNLPEDPADKANAELLAYRAITEAMLNVDYHAYPEREDEKFWWFTAVILEGDLYISLCDRGVGIPNTLPRTEWWEKAMGLLRINDDAEMIRLAMTYTRTSARSNRGRGLGTKDMQNLVLQKKNGFLTIISGRGYYTLDGSKDDGREESRTMKVPIVGTAINWKIPLGKKNGK